MKFIVLENRIACGSFSTACCDWDSLGTSVDLSAKVKHEVIENKLKQMGVQDSRTEKEVNIYYKLKEGYFRIRITKEKILCTLKTGELGDAREEYEFHVDRAEPLVKLFEVVGCEVDIVFLRTKNHINTMVLQSSLRGRKECLTMWRLKNLLKMKKIYPPTAPRGGVKTKYSFNKKRY